MAKMFGFNRGCAGMNKALVWIVLYVWLVLWSVVVGLKYFLGR